MIYKIQDTTTGETYAVEADTENQAQLALVKRIGISVADQLVIGQDNRRPL